MGDNLFNDSLSDVNIVKNLIINRYEIKSCLNSNSISMEYVVEVIDMYIRLNEILSSIHITVVQNETLLLVNKGLNYSEIGRITGKDRTTIREIFHRLCVKIVQENNKRQ